jgi:NMD protein affecting ribosome stability and mRNA decay
MQSTFGGEYKESASIFTKIDGKDVYRLTILFRGMGEAKKGDHILYRGEEYEIKLVGKDVLLQEVDTGKKVHVKYEEMKKFKKA